MDQQRAVHAAAGPLVRRWPWAVGAAVLGAAAGGAIARLVHRVGGVDAPDAQEPGELEAVVDRPRLPAPVSPSPGTSANDPAQVAEPLGIEPPKP